MGKLGIPKIHKFNGLLVLRNYMKMFLTVYIEFLIMNPDSSHSSSVNKGNNDVENGIGNAR